MGFWLNINDIKHKLSFVLLVVNIVIYLMVYKKSVSNLLILAMLILIYIPMGSIYSLMNQSTRYYLIANSTFYIIVVFTELFDKLLCSKTYLQSNVTDKRNTQYTLHYKNINLIPLLMIFSLVVIIVMTLVNYQNVQYLIHFDLKGVYNIRKLTRYPFGMGYFFSWQTKVVAPYLIYYFYSKGKYFRFLVLIFTQLWFFLLTGHKMVLFGIVPIAIIIFTKITQKNAFILLNYSVSLITLFSALTLKFNTLMIDFFIRRIFHLPALILFYYYDYYSNAQFVFWKNIGFVNLFFKDKDFILPSIEIGSKYFYKPSNAIVGFIGSEFANAGIFGIILTSILVALIFVLVEKNVNRLGFKIVMVTMLFPIYSLLVTSFTTALLTGGIISGLLLLSFTSIQNGERYELKKQ